MSSSGLMKKRRQENNFVFLPYICYPMQLSGYFPIKSVSTKKENTSSKTLLIYSSLLLLLATFFFLGSIVDILNEITDPQDSVHFTYQGIYLITLFQGIANQLLSIINWKSLAKVLRTFNTVSRSYYSERNDQKCLLITLFVFLISTIFTIMMTYTSNSVNIHGNFTPLSIDSFILENALLPRSLYDDSAAVTLIFILQSIVIFHCFSISLIANSWISIVSNTLSKSIKNSKIELLNIGCKSDRKYEKQFWVWNSNYSQLNLISRNIVKEFSLPLCIITICNPLLFCLNMYWFLHDFKSGGIKLLFPGFVTVLQLARLAFLCIKGSDFLKEVNSLILDTQKLDASELTPVMKYQLKTIFIREGTDPVYLTAGKLFPITKSFFLSIMGTVFTVVVVFVQIAPQKLTC